MKVGRPKGLKLSVAHRARIRLMRIRPGARTVGFASNYRHGMCGTPTYNSFRAMHQRCSERGKYAKFGTKICADWVFFENFLADMGMRPAGMTLDRIDVKGHYEPSNCRWADKSSQAVNTRRNKASG